MQNTVEDSIINWDTFFKYLNIILANWKKLAILVFSVCSVAVAMLLLTPNYYVSSVTILPPSGKSDLSGLLNLASQLGYGSSSSESVVNTPQIISKIVRSRALYDMLVEREYYNSRKNKKEKLAEIFKVKEKDQAKKDFYTHQALNKAITTNIDTRTKSLEVSLQVNDAQLSAELLNAIVEELDNYNKLYRNNKAKSNREFVEGRLKDTGDSLKKYEEALKLFREENRQITQSPMLMLKQQRLIRKLSISQELYILLSKEYESAKLQEVRDTPVLDIIEMAKPLPVKSGPLRTKSLMMVAVFTLIAGILFLLIKEFLLSSGLLDRIKQLDGYQSMVRDLSRIFKRKINVGA